MAFTYTITGLSYFGDKRVAFGTFTNAGSDTGGDIDTGLSRADFFQSQHTGSAVVASAPVANETFPLGSGTVTIITVAGADGIWYAIGN